MIFKICMFLFIGCSSLLVGASHWETDYQKGLEISRETKKPVLLFFSGSDWSGWSMKMKKELLDTKTFLEETKKLFVLVELDFPLHKEIDPILASQNEELKAAFKIQEFPRLVVLDSNEKEIARFGYLDESPEKFAQDLKQILHRNEDLTNAIASIGIASFSSNKLEALYEEACELKRLDDANFLLECGLQSEDALIFLLEKYRLLSEEGKSDGKEASTIRQHLVLTDLDNQKKVHFSLALIDFQNLASRKELLASPKEAVKPLEDYLSKFGFQDEDNRWRLEIMIAQFYLDCDDCKTALVHLERARNSAPQENKEEIVHSLDYIQKQLAQVD